MALARSSRTFAAFVAPLVLAASASACSSYRYGPPPLPPEPGAPASERCFYDRNLTVTHASGRVDLLNETRGDGQYIYVRGRSVSGDGLTFYRGEERLDPDEGLEALGDPALLSNYERDRDRLSGADTLQTFSRVTWITLMAGGLGLTLAGIPNIEVNAAGELEPLGIALVSAGIGAMLVSTIFILIDYKQNEDAAEYEMRKNIYFPRDEERPRLGQALDARARGVAKACGRTDVPPPVPSANAPRAELAR